MAEISSDVRTLAVAYAEKVMGQRPATHPDDPATYAEAHDYDLQAVDACEMATHVLEFAALAGRLLPSGGETAEETLEFLQRDGDETTYRVVRLVRTVAQWPQGPIHRVEGEWRAVNE